ncbi:hypothetical protein FAM09_11690 [Niastella caeni]|uniref:Lipocalin-like domain-containing protein n=1 Tax=Niastella caeni TaxID=2569763 RepID=A0A4S8HVF9_9BACT|nr:DUF5991 domain-containing protein [Niastella caeni]THU39171.1 hypothetical protein FAM09_11690 [Niastella caeni]
MKKIVAVPLFLFILFSCSKTNTFIHCSDWVGDYTFHEDPVPTATGINKIMQWELSVTQQNDTCWGTLEITGLTTYIKLLTTLSGDSSRVDVMYNKYLDGSEDFKQGEVLFSLSRDSNKIITRWNRLQPLLADNPEAEGACFRLLKKAKYKDL